MADDTIFLGKADKRQNLFLPMANRHGLVTGATGTGKTVTLQIMAEGFCKAGVPVFAADVKGDLAGISQEGTPQDFLLERARKVGFVDYGFEATPTIFWDLFGEQGHPIRTTISKWARCSCRASWASPMRRRVPSTSPSRSPMKRALPFSTSRICARCFPIS